MKAWMSAIAVRTGSLCHRAKRGIEDAAQPVDESDRGQRGRFASMLKFNMTV